MKTNINLGEEEIVDDLRNDGNAGMPEKVKRANPWNNNNKKIMIMTIYNLYLSHLV
jgi:hypothetical protein